MKRKYGWSDEVEVMVAWDAVHQAIKTKTISQKRAIVKIIHEWNQTNRRKANEDPTNDGTCCECGEHEDAKYVYRCEHIRRAWNQKKYWLQSTKRLRRWVDDRILHHMWLGLHGFEKEHEPEAGPI
jgi:hypothetical protein